MVSERLKKTVVERLMHYRLSCSYCEDSTELTVPTNTNGFGIDPAFIRVAEEQGWALVPIVEQKRRPFWWWLSGQPRSYEVRCPRHAVEMDASNELARP